MPSAPNSASAAARRILGNGSDSGARKSGTTGLTNPGRANSLINSSIRRFLGNGSDSGARKSGTTGLTNPGRANSLINSSIRRFLGNGSDPGARKSGKTGKTNPGRANSLMSNSSIRRFIDEVGSDHGRQTENQTRAQRGIRASSGLNNLGSPPPPALPNSANGNRLLNFLNRSANPWSAQRGVRVPSARVRPLEDAQSPGRLIGSGIRSAGNIMPPANSQNPPIDWNIISSVSFLNRERSEKLKKCEQDGCKKAFAEAKRSKWEDGVFGKFGKRGTYARRTSTAQELSPDDPLLGLRDSSGISTTAFRSDAAHLRGLLAPRTADGEDMCVETGREIKASAGFFLHKFQYNKVAETPASMRHKKLLGAVDQFKNFKVSLDGDLRERDPAVWAAKKVAKHLLHKSALLSSRASRVPSQILMADAQWLARKFGWRSPDGSKKISTLRAPTPRRNRSSRNNTNN